MKSEQQLQKEWKARMDLDTLRAAQQIREDRNRLTAAQAQGKREMQTLKKVTAGKPQSGKKGK